MFHIYSLLDNKCMGMLSWSGMVWQKYKMILPRNQLTHMKLLAYYTYMHPNPTPEHGSLQNKDVSLLA